MTGSALTSDVPLDRFLGLIRERKDEVRSFLEFAEGWETGGASLRLAERPDIRHASETAAEFAERWWGVVVFTCFGAKKGAGAVAPYFREPIPAEVAEIRLRGLELPAGSIGHHRIQPGHVGAKAALIAACRFSNEFHDIVFSGEDFDSRYVWLRGLRARQWGRTTAFDLLLRVGALGISGKVVLPGRAYLAGSTGPARGFKKIFGIPINDQTADEGEAILRTWTTHWHDVVNEVGASWSGDPYTPGDFENALCIYQER